MSVWDGGGRWPRLKVSYFSRPGEWLSPYTRGLSSLAYNARSREEVDSVLAEAAAAGAKILKPAQEVFWGGYSGYFSDLDGFSWEIAWNPSFPIGEDGSIHIPD
jgi:uncharacterized glyoxalase superfamily protein PhnB